MSLPYSSTTNLPQGFETVSCGGTHIVEAVSGNTAQSRVISRTDQFGDVSDFMVRTSSEPIEITITVQRADNTVAIPAAGTAFTYDYDRSGTQHDLVVKDTIVNRDKDSFDTFDIVAVVKPPVAS
jgi:hypothetical protein